MLVAHGAANFMAVPSALRLIKDDHAFHRLAVLLKIVIPEVMNVLNERFYLASRFTDAQTQARVFIARQRLAQHVDQGTVAGQKYRVLVLVHAGSLGNKIQASQCLACTRNTGHEANRLLVISLRLLDNLHKVRICDTQIFPAGVRTRDLLHAMVAIKCLSGLDNRWRRLVSAGHPFARVERRLTSILCRHLTKRDCQSPATDQDGLCDVIWKSTNCAGRVTASVAITTGTMGRA